MLDEATIRETLLKVESEAAESTTRANEAIAERQRAGTANDARELELRERELRLREELAALDRRRAELYEAECTDVKRHRDLHLAEMKRHGDALEVIAGCLQASRDLIR
jgi:glycine/D-amino acid oxidase-like deaminating enzyme